ncbi:hypothetical protein COCC4DRAFT_31194 [Bipolaris maydis ATCC 48331]|uniref:Uncharacterized protein n=2 Tax=Cochliobolus heterostrophus TaxID=5016 RepID=M2V069_COCH5|nr:uncharacterized protein COCC4DRAFT_31194 [Bipolaris maydis ATCC 48331]EMD93428.1 hypothetical protein COCHEDRAFT_1020509 [Bipolaris maydis C5]KAJ5027749.1 hypothetical protein J3E73DRAFT_295434 [Bipolaris maydis]ENI07123.1 hypothetical protein COCC4DRAFT_31194 [Bipolaris maydis ATCC 48331]KAJ6266613.1 hypothetical protein PSV08DRAFT_332770 [Bipolaris maydis]KAJ6283057.1 hypothetical protein J3E71DRAFT_279043 [Bipolaris maydis]
MTLHAYFEHKQSFNTFKTCMKATCDTTTNTCNAKLTPPWDCLGHSLRKMRSASKSSNNENGNIATLR